MAKKSVAYIGKNDPLISNGARKVTVLLIKDPPLYVAVSK
jgi:hypothetical protein